MRIREGDVADRDDILGFDAVAGDEPVRVQLIDRVLASGACLVAERDRRVVGYAALEYSFFESGFVPILYVAERERRQGIGRALMQAVASRCRTRKLFTSTNRSNRAMQALLGSLGYARSGIVHDLDPGDPELIYCLDRTEPAGRNAQLRPLPGAPGPRSQGSEGRAVRDSALGWARLEKEAPEIAGAGRRLLPEVSFLATVDARGRPRLHPFCPVLVRDRLWAFVIEESPKRRDLDRNGRFAIHALPGPEDEEFYVAGTASRVEDVETGRAVLAAMPYDDADERHLLYEFVPDRALWTRWENFQKPGMRPIHRVWRAGQETKSPRRPW